MQNSNPYPYERPTKSHSSSRRNFQTYELLTKQEDLINQLDSNLQQEKSLLENSGETYENEQQFEFGKNAGKIEFELDPSLKDFEISDLKSIDHLLEDRKPKKRTRKRLSDQKPLDLDDSPVRLYTEEEKSEIEFLKQQIVQMKSDHFQQFAELQKGNEELLETY